VSGLIKTFESDWTASAVDEHKQTSAKVKGRKKVSKVLVKELSALSPIVKEALKEAKAEIGNAVLNPQEVKDTVKEAVKEAVRERVEEVVKETITPT